MTPKSIGLTEAFKRLYSEYATRAYNRGAQALEENQFQLARLCFFAAMVLAWGERDHRVLIKSIAAAGYTFAIEVRFVDDKELIFLSEWLARASLSLAKHWQISESEVVFATITLGLAKAYAGKFTEQVTELITEVEGLQILEVTDTYQLQLVTQYCVARVREDESQYKFYLSCLTDALKRFDVLTKYSQAPGTFWSILSERAAILECVVDYHLAGGKQGKAAAAFKDLSEICHALALDGMPLRQRLTEQLCVRMTALAETGQ